MNSLISPQLGFSPYLGSALSAVQVWCRRDAAAGQVITHDEHVCEQQAPGLMDLLPPPSSWPDPAGNSSPTAGRINRDTSLCPAAFPWNKTYSILSPTSVYLHEETWRKLAKGFQSSHGQEEEGDGQLSSRAAQVHIPGPLPNPHVAQGRLQVV